MTPTARALAAPIVVAVICLAILTSLFGLAISDYLTCHRECAELRACLSDFPHPSIAVCDEADGGVSVRRAAR